MTTEKIRKHAEEAVYLAEQAYAVLEDETKTHDEKQAEYEKMMGESDSQKALADQLRAAALKRDEVRARHDELMQELIIKREYAKEQELVKKGLKEPVDRSYENPHYDAVDAFATKQQTHEQIEAANDHRKLIMEYLTNNPTLDKKALSTLLGPAGGFLIDPRTEANFIADLPDYVFYRRAGTVRRMTLGEIPILRSNDHLVATWPGETQQRTETTDEDFFELVTVRPHDLTAFIRVSTKLMEDTRMLENILINDARMQFAEAETKAFTIGTGINEPLGVFVDSKIQTVNTGTADTLSSDDLLNLTYQLKQQHREGSSFIMHRSLISHIRQMKEGTTGQYIWQRSLAAGQPDTLAGYPVYENEHSAAAPTTGTTFTTGDRVVAFGDMRQIHIYDRLGTTIQQLNELYAQTGQIGLMFRKRVTSLVVTPDAFRILVIA